LVAEGWPTGMFASRAAAIARWLSLRCRLLQVGRDHKPDRVVTF
jgi:hypothetical protein